jgi:hypothetical protein
MKVLNNKSSGWIASAVNIAPATPEQERQFVQEWKQGGHNSLFWPVWVHYATLYSLHLRQFVDAWIETGVQADGTEAPMRRHLPADLLQVVNEFLAQHPARVSIGLVLGEGRPRPRQCAMINLDDEPVPDAKAMWEVDGEPVGHLDAKLTKDPIGFIRAEALRLFVMGIALTNSADCLCKCRYQRCSQYFVLKSARDRAYKGGTFCSPRHRRLNAATKCTTQKRRHAEVTLLNFAARMLQKWKTGPEWDTDRRTKARLARAVSDFILGSGDPNLSAYRLIVQVNWATRNRVKIERYRAELETAVPRSGKKR